jgi:hypothetical protein
VLVAVRGCALSHGDRWRRVGPTTVVGYVDNLDISEPGTFMVYGSAPELYAAVRFAEVVTIERAQPLART